MKKAMDRRLRRVEEEIRRRMPIPDGYNARTVLAERLRQLGARLRVPGTPAAEPLSESETQAIFERWQACLARMRTPQGRAA